MGDQNCDCSLKNALGRSVAGFSTYASDRLYDFGAKKFKSWTGYGDYTIHANSLINGSGSGDPILETRGRTIRIAYREYLGEVTTGPVVGAFSSTSYQINPGNILSFPWLAPIAQQYDQYKPLGIIYEFKSTASDNTSNTALGSVIMATEYDVNDAAFTSKQEMLNAAYSSEAKASSNLIHGIECDPRELQRNVFYVRQNGDSVAGIRDFDLARFTVATQGGGLAANQSIGSLYVHYEFELLKEQAFGGLAGKERIYGIYINPTGINPANRELAQFYGTTVASMKTCLAAGNDLGIYVTSNTIYFPRKWAGGCFRIKLNCSSPNNYDCVSIIPGVNTFCSVIAQPTALFSGDSASTASWTNTSGYRTTVTCQATAAEVVIQLDTIINAEFATFVTGALGIIPIAVAACKARLEVEVVPADWYLA